MEPPQTKAKIKIAKILIQWLIVPAPSPRPPPGSKTTIILLPAEKVLRYLLLDCRQQLPNPDIEIWITGGWVRDRLLGIPCSDVDIAMSNMTGVQFGDALTSFLQKNNDNYQQRASHIVVDFRRFTGFHVTKKNGGRLFDLDLDLVNLRKEVYGADCRTPEMEFGTAREDVFRRDATVNALFFDLIHKRVADFTQQGLDDLSAGVMRTPLEPRQTFLDDPLRVLRFIRIGSKLGYRMDGWRSYALGGVQGNSCRLEREIASLSKDLTRNFGYLIRSEKQDNMLWSLVAYTPLVGLDKRHYELAVDEAINAVKGTKLLYKMIEASLKNLESIRSTITLLSLDEDHSPSRSTIGMAMRK
ncbi:hypothetical protein BGZ63DRAFT_406242 [Mariannaea sp. PMI_226]|nr:hypothetical protein BGZ63DRAFT_406242 [Mariannaea sp. PMI_226]